LTNQIDMQRSFSTLTLCNNNCKRYWKQKVRWAYKGRKGTYYWRWRVRKY